MITLPQLREGDILEATINKQEGWMRVTEIKLNAIHRAQFIKSGTRQEIEVIDPEIEEVIMLIRAEYEAGSLFEALVRTLGVATAVQITSANSGHGRRAGLAKGNKKPGPNDGDKNPKPKKN